MTLFFPKVVRMWHKTIKGEWCHAWDIEHAAFEAWKKGDIPLPASKTLLPSGHHPAVGTHVVCGTCHAVTGPPDAMKQEVVSIKGA